MADSVFWTDICFAWYGGRHHHLLYGWIWLNAKGSGTFVARKITATVLFSFSLRDKKVDCDKFILSLKIVMKEVQSPQCTHNEICGFCDRGKNAKIGRKLHVIKSKKPSNPYYSWNDDEKQAPWNRDSWDKFRESHTQENVTWCLIFCFCLGCYGNRARN